MLTSPVKPVRVDGPRLDRSAAAVVTDVAPAPMLIACGVAPAASVQTLRTKVRSVGSTAVPFRGAMHNVDWAELDIVEWLTGDKSAVDARFVKSLFVMTDTGACNADGQNCVSALPNTNVAALRGPKGDERVVLVRMPPQGESDVPVPPALRAKYGGAAPLVESSCKAKPGDGEPASLLRVTPEVLLGPYRADGAATEGQHWAALKARVPRLRSCFVRALAENANATVSAELHVERTEQGPVATVTDGDLQPTLKDCVVRASAAAVLPEGVSSFDFVMRMRAKN